MKKRPGITLLEVLIAIFVMAIGMLALLVLFPVGALNMARAIRDDRTASAAHNATNTAVMWDLRFDPGVEPALAQLSWGGGGFNDAIPDGPGHPVYVDPFYFDPSVPRGNPLGQLPARTPGLTRCGVSFRGQYALTTAAAQQVPAERWFTLLDDINFGEDAIPAGPSVDREGSYTWAYLLRRPIASDPNTVEMTVVVYSGRATQIPGGETPYTARGNKDDRSITITHTGEAPPIRAGTWLLDVSYENKATSTTPAYGYVHNNLYRALSTKELNTTTVAVEIEQPLVESFPPSGNHIVVLEDVVEVFPRGTDWLP